ncbi:MAG: type II secretion system F family protein [Bryobacterales bacterium]|nr:type II secretion system F family protein [Bryobacterales bacterium]
MHLVPIFFITVFGLICAAILIANRIRRQPAGTGAPPTTQIGEWYAPTLLRNESLSTISVWATILARFAQVVQVREHIMQAGLQWSVGRLTAMMLLAGTASAAVFWRLGWTPWTITLLIGFVAGLGPYMAVIRRRRLRIEQVERVFPDCLESLARSMRAGNALVPSLDLAARETAQPLGGELRRLVDERNLGLDLGEALNNLADRVPLAEVRTFVAAIQLHSRTGGRLNEVLAQLATSMRENSVLRGEIHSIAAHGKATGKLLTILPLVLVALMLFLEPSGLILLWNDPLGHQLIWAAMVCLILAWVVIRRMVEVRW